MLCIFPTPQHNSIKQISAETVAVLLGRPGTELCQQADEHTIAKMLKVLQMLVMTVTVLQKVEFSTCGNTCNSQLVPIVGRPGPKGDEGPQGPMGQKGSAGENYVGGSIYTRWGRTTCDTTGTELVYAGTAAGTKYNHKGGGANLLCLPDNPVYESFSPGISDKHIARLGPVEAHPHVTLGSTSSGLDWNDNAPCAVCRTTRPTTMMIPATIYCPSGWTREYYGYLMTSDEDENRGTFVCLDRFAQKILNSSGQTEVAHDLFHVEAYCDIIPCPPYNDYKELTCAVCSK